MPSSSKALPSKDVYIRSVSIRGFKSFGAQMQKFTFGEGMNLIAGANGSGKSNILEAICFVLCEKTSTLRIQRLSELQSSNTDEPCEAILEIESKEKNRSRHRSELSVQILPDGISRQYKLDGKIKTIKEVKEFLHERRLLMEDTSAVLHQSKVTDLADTNSPATLASIISAASGAGRWNEEVERAQQELKKTRRGLQDIQENIMMLEKAIVKDDARMANMSRIRKLNFEIATSSKRLCDFRHRSISSLNEKIGEKKAQITHKRGSAEAQKQVLREQEADLATLKKISSVTPDHITLQRSQLMEAKAAKEEEKWAYEKRLDMANKDMADLENCNHLIQNLETSISLLSSQLHEKQELIKKLDRDSNGAAVQFYTEDLKGMINNADEKLKELHLQQIAISGALKVISTEKLFKESRLAKAEEELSRILQCSSSQPAEFVLSNSLHSLSAEKAHLRNKLDNLTRKQQVLSDKLGVLSIEEAGFPAWPLHTVFRFEEVNSKTEDYLLPLSVIAGSLRKVCITETTTAAAHLLQIWERNNNLTCFSRIWPLDRLNVADRLHYQRSVQAKYPKGSVTVPIDLLRFDRKFEKAVQRAFGGYVISSSDDIAKDLIEKHGIWNVSCDGKVSRRGSISGGWRGDNATSFMSVKFEKDGLDTELEASMIMLNQIEKELENASQVLMNVHGLNAQKSVLLEEITLIKQEIDALSREMSQQENNLRENVKLSSIFREGLERSKNRLQALPTSTEDGGKLLQKAQEAEKFDEAAILDALEKQTSEQQHTWMLQRKLKRRLQLTNVSELKQAIEQYGKEIEEINRKLHEIDASLDQVRIEEEKKAAQLLSTIGSIDNSKARIAEILNDIAGLEKSVARLEAAQCEAKEEIEKLSKFQNDCDSELVGIEDIENEHEFTMCKQSLRKSILELGKLKTKEEQVTLEEQLVFKERTEKLHLFKQHWTSISESIDVLVDGIDNCKAVVQEANEATFEIIRQSFIECCMIILPNMSFDLVKVGNFVEDGIKFSFCNFTANTYSNDWKTNLQELSGGQRTLLSIAFIMMVARCGETALYLMDEVDAALDEQNQERVARLIQSTIGKTSQVIAVSHNICFQRYCDTIVKVHMVDGSTKLQQEQ